MRGLKDIGTIFATV